jgi:hypothetical protein
MVPKNLHGSMRARLNLNQFLANQKLKRDRVNAVRIHSANEKIVGRPIQTSDLEQNLIPVAELIAAVTNHAPDSPVYLSVPEHNIQIVVPAAWLHLLSTHLTPLTNPLMRVSPQGKA